MKCIIFASLLAIACGSPLVVKLDNFDYEITLGEALKANGIEPYILEDTILTIIDDVIHSIGDPAHLNDTEFDIDLLDSNIRLVGDFKDATLVGLTNYTVDKISFNGISAFSITIVFHTIKADGTYAVDGSLAKLIPIYGDGGFNLSIDDFRFGLDVHVSPFNGSLIVKSLELDLGLKSFYIMIANFLGGLGDVINEILDDNLAEYVDRFMYWHGPQLENGIAAAVNTTLEGVTIGDLLNWLKNYTSSRPTTAAPVVPLVKLY